MEKEADSGRYGALIVFIVLLSILAILVFGLIVLSEDAPDANTNSDKEKVVVEQVIDGMSFKSGDRTIRLVCVDAPEEGEMFYQEAKDFLSAVVLGKNVSLDKESEDEDSSGRLLRYVYLNEEFVNKLVVLNGLAQFKKEVNASARCDELEQAEEEAMRYKRGMWAIENYSCDVDSYNCNNFSNAKQAQLVFDFCGGAGKDVHFIDNDKDGVACE